VGRVVVVFGVCVMLVVWPCGPCGCCFWCLCWLFGRVGRVVVVFGVCVGCLAV